MSDAPELKPCPFCGGEAVFSLGRTGEGNPWHYIECETCEAMGPSVQYAEHMIRVKDCLAIAWNSRADIADDKLQRAANLLSECAAELIEYVEEDWPVDARSQKPSSNPKYIWAMELPRRVEAMVAEIKGEKK